MPTGKPSSIDSESPAQPTEDYPEGEEPKPSGPCNGKDCPGGPTSVESESPVPTEDDDECIEEPVPTEECYGHHCPILPAPTKITPTASEPEPTGCSGAECPEGEGQVPVESSSPAGPEEECTVPECGDYPETPEEVEELQSSSPEVEAPVPTGGYGTNGTDGESPAVPTEPVQAGGVQVAVSLGLVGLVAFLAL